jgi:hypothetical protein
MVPSGRFHSLIQEMNNHHNPGNTLTFSLLFSILLYIAILMNSPEPVPPGDEALHSSESLIC